MAVILTFIVIDAKTNESETNLNTHSFLSVTGMTLSSIFLPFNYSSNSLPNGLWYKEAFCLNEAVSVKQMRLNFDYDLHSRASSLIHSRLYLKDPISSSVSLPQHSCTCSRSILFDLHFSENKLIYGKVYKVLSHVADNFFKYYKCYLNSLT